MVNEGRDAVIELAMCVDEGVAPPEHPLPPGCTLRRYREGEESTWSAIQRATGIYGPLPGSLFEREFGEAPELLAERQLFVEDAHGEAIGTATAWFGPDGPDGFEGRLHWIAVVPRMQRQGLGRALTCAAWSRLLALGHRSVYLTTGSQNLPAIRMYRGLGFRPLLRADEERSAWTALAEGPA